MHLMFHKTSQDKQVMTSVIIITQKYSMSALYEFKIDSVGVHIHTFDWHNRTVYHSYHYREKHPNHSNRHREIHTHTRTHF